MASTAAQMRNYRGSALFSFGFRPFFLSGAVVAAILPIVTALAFAGFFQFNSSLGVITWHAHEMVFGFVAAIISGFILTAVPNWTGRLPVLGWRLDVLFGLWLAGRGAML